MRISDWSSDVCSSDLPNIRQCCLHYAATRLIAKALLQITEWLRMRFEAMHFCVRKQLQHDYGLVALVGSAIEHGGNGRLSCQTLQSKKGVVTTLYVQDREEKNSVEERNSRRLNQVTNEEQVCRIH